MLNKEKVEVRGKKRDGLLLILHVRDQGSAVGLSGLSLHHIHFQGFRHHQ
jgi:hypothetical protein